MTPLDGITVLDLTRLLPGAETTQWLADFGAEVIKIEQPEIGDYGRRNFEGEGESPTFTYTNRGKKSLTIDLKNPAGKDAFLNLASRADILIEGFRPEVMDRLGFGYDFLHARYPRLIYVALAGYVPGSRYAQFAGHDVNYLALSGVLDLNGPADGPPCLPGVQVADLAASLQAVIGILLALEARHRTGRGQRVDVSLFASAAGALPVAISSFIATGAIPCRGKETLTGRFACYQIYQAARGTFITVGALEPKFWRNLCVELGCEHLIQDQYANDGKQSEMKAMLSAKFLSATAEEWFSRLGARDCCVTPVRSLSEAIADHPAEPGPSLSETPGRRCSEAPRLGEHNDEFL